MAAIASGATPAVAQVPHSIDDAAAQAQDISKNHVSGISDKQSEQAAKSIYFVDGTLEDLLPVLRKKLSPNDRIILIGSENPFVEMADAIRAMSGIDAIHIFSHGEAGQLKFNGRIFDAKNVAAHSAEALKSLGSALSADADILIYGCDLAANADGVALIGLISNLTGADVAASNDITGSGQLNGNWALEHRTGAVQANSVQLPAWTGKLWNTELFNAGWFGDTGSPAGATGPHPKASVPSDARFSTIGDNIGGTGLTFAITQLGSSTVQNSGGATSTSFAAAVAANDYFYSNLTVANTNGVALSKLTYNQVNQNPTAARMQIVLYDTVTAVSTTLSGAILIDGTLTTQTATFTRVGMVPGRTYQLRFYSWGCTATLPCYTDNISIYSELNQSPTATNDAFSTPYQTTVGGNLVSTNNGSGVDGDPEAQALTVDRINTTAFTVNSAIALTNGTLTITNAATGAFTFQPNAGFSGTQTFTYRVNDGFGGTATATATITVLPVAISLAKILLSNADGGASGGVTVGDVLTYRITATNQGGVVQTNVVVSDPKITPASTTCATVAVSGTCILTGTYTVTQADVDAGHVDNSASVTSTLITTPITTPVLVTPALSIIVTTNDSVSGVNGVAGATGVLNVFSGDTVNGVAASAANSILTATTTVPAGLTFNTANGTIDVAAGTAAGTYSFTYRLCETRAPTNCKTATASVTVSPATDLVISKSNGVSSVASGSTTTYTITATNNGPNSSTGAKVTDTPVSGITCPSTNAVTVSSGGSYTVADLTGAGITLGTIANGGSVTLSYTCTVN